MNVSEFKSQLKEIRQDAIDNESLTDQELNDIKASVILLIMYTNHRVQDGAIK